MERRGDYVGHDGGVDYEGSMNGVVYLLLMGQMVRYKIEKLIICAAESKESAW